MDSSSEEEPLEHKHTSLVHKNSDILAKKQLGLITAAQRVSDGTPRSSSSTDKCTPQGSSTFRAPRGWALRAAL